MAVSSDKFRIVGFATGQEFGVVRLRWREWGDRFSEKIDDEIH